MCAAQIEDLYPLAPMQQGILFHSLYAPDSGAYIIQASYGIHGDLNVALFEQAWQQVIVRHPILRTAFIWENIDDPVQAVLRTITVPLQQHDWRDQPPSAQEQQLKAFLQADRQQGFVLSKAPLMRLTLIRLADAAYHFIWSVHHLLVDGWSISLVLKEVFSYYTAFAQARDVRLEPSRPYRDFIQWLRQQDLAKAKAFWQQTLKGFSAPTPFGIDRDAGRTAKSQASTDHQDLRLPEPMTTALRDFAREHRLTLNTVLLGAWALLLSRYSSEQDIVFGATVAGRPETLPGANTIVGVFINTLPLRVQVTPRATLLPWLKQIQAHQVEARQYEYSPLVEVQSWSDVPHGQSLFESILVFENLPLDSALLDLTEASAIRNAQVVDYTSYPLALIVVPGRELSIRVTYNASRFDAPTISRVLGNMQTVLEALPNNSEQRLAKIPVLTGSEFQQIVSWNQTATSYPQDLLIHQIVEAQAARTPDNIALIFKDARLTYQELNQRANQLAHHLRSLGVAPDSCVGICAERSIEMVLAILGVVKAGAAYLPLDPTYPQDRLQFMLEDARACVLLTQEHLAARLPAYAVPTICLDSQWERIASADVENPTTRIDSANLAYIIYTSGSTGKPKGVMNSHGGIRNRLLWMQEMYNLSEADVVLQKTPFSFDVSVWEFFWPLMTGARLVLARPEGHKDPRYLVEVITQQQVTTLHFVPSMLQLFLEDEQVTSCRSLKRVICSGEALPVELQKRFFERLDAQLHNLYGPTEAAVDVSFWACTPQGDHATVPIGRPVANTQLYILDSELQPVPVGVAGELYIGGVQLARGYLNRPALTAATFVPDPFSHEVPSGSGTRPGSRIYKTGDRACYASDGAIIYLGRLDHQVKLRGFRIELGEIESALRQHEAVQDAVVLLRDERLVAYVVKNLEPRAKDQGENQEPGTQSHDPEVDGSRLFVLGSAELRTFLASRLPDYMIPSAFVFLDTMPLTGNGKLDRSALPAPDQNRADLDGSFVAPRDTLELQLARIWEDLLNIRPVGVTDNFFDLGGHSLLVMRLVTRIQKQFSRELSLATIFQAPTVEEQAQVLRQHDDSAPWSPLVKIQPHGSARPLFCFHPAVGNILCYTDLARHVGPDQPVYGLQAPGLDGEQEPMTRLEDMVALYIESIRTVQPKGPYLLVGYCVGAVFAFEAAQQLQRQGEQVALLAQIDGGAPKEHYAELSNAQLAAWFAWELSRSVGKELILSVDDLEQLEPPQQLGYILEHAKLASVVPPDMRPVQVGRLLHLFTTNVRAVRSYKLHTYPDRIVLFRPEERSPEDDLSMGWSAWTAETIETHIVPGDHWTMVRKPHVQVLAERLRICIAEAQGLASLP